MAEINLFKLTFLALKGHVFLQFAFSNNSQSTRHQI